MIKRSHYQVGSSAIYTFREWSLLPTDECTRTLTLPLTVAVRPIWKEMHHSAVFGSVGGAWKNARRPSTISSTSVPYSFSNCSFFSFNA